MPTRNITLPELIERFHSEDACREALERLRWPDGVACLRCGSLSISRITTVDRFECNSCGYQFSATVGTIFHDTHLPLWKWFLTTYMICESRKGMSANQVRRTLGVTYKTAWYLCHRIRAAMQETNPKPLSGTVEADESWVGGKERGKRGSRKHKTIVAGVIQRGGQVRLKVIGDVTRKTLHEFIRRHIRPDTQRVITDSWPAYRGIGDHDTKHEVVDHNIKEWVRGDVHTNTVENVWSLLSRSIMGSYHHLSEKHLDAYLDELEWRFNNRANPYLFRDTLLRLLRAENLPYQELTE
jgi:transposase-like protein